MALCSYAPIGDGRTIALVADDGAVDWFPIPDLESVPVFAAVVDSANGGRLELATSISFFDPAAILARPPQAPQSQPLRISAPDIW